MKVLEISKDDLKYNLNLIQNKISNKSEIIAVVKANGMGLDLIKYCKFLIEEGINFFGVSCPDDAIILRKNEIDKNILLMAESYNKEELTELIKSDIILTIGSIEEKNRIEELSKILNKNVRAHVKIDTGFGRFRFYL